MALMSPTKFSRTSLVEFDGSTPRRPYLTFQVGPGNIHRLVVKIWSNDQGFTSSSRNQTDPFGGSHTWFAFGLVQELDGVEDAPLEDLVGFQRNLCASKIIQNHVNEWTFGLPIEDDDDAEVQCWLESLTQVENVKIGIFPLARYQAWVNTVWKIEVDVYHGDQIESALAPEEISHPVALHDTTLYHRRTRTRSCATQIPSNDDVSIVMESAIGALQENNTSHSPSGAFWRSLGARVQETRSPQVLDAFIRALSLEVNSSTVPHDNRFQTSVDDFTNLPVESLSTDNIQHLYGTMGTLIHAEKSIPPCVWVINEHDEDILVVVSKFRPNRMVSSSGMDAFSTGAGTNVESVTFEKPACQKVLPALVKGRGDVSIGVFPLWTRKEGFGVISIFKGESKELSIEDERIPLGSTAFFSSEATLKVVDYYNNVISL